MKLISVNVERGDSGCLSNMGSKQVGFMVGFNTKFSINHDKPLPEPNLRFGEDSKTSLDSEDYYKVMHSIESKEFELYVHHCLINWLHHSIPEYNGE